MTPCHAQFTIFPFCNRLGIETGFAPPIPDFVDNPVEFLPSWAVEYLSRITTFLGAYTTDLPKWAIFDKTAGKLDLEWESDEWNARSVAAWQGTALE